MKLNVIRPSPIDSAELTELNPRKPSALTTGEYTDELATVSPPATLKKGNAQNANAIAAMHDLDTMSF
jgi:hypothetical protein